MPSPPHSRLDVAFIRSCFPAFAHPPAAHTAFFENAGGSYVAAPVLDRLTRYHQQHRVQPYGASEICRLAGEEMDLGRRTMADLLGVASDTLTLGPSTTQNLHTLALACEGLVGGGDKVVVSGQDHEANIGAWQQLCERRGAEFVAWPVDARSGELSPAALESLLDSRVKIVCMTHSSNIIGSVNPVAEVVAMCHRHGAYAVIDGVSFAPHRWPDLNAMAPDAYCFSTYKTYATHLGVMYTAPEFAAALTPQCHYFNRDSAHKRFDTAGPDHAAIAALAGLGEYFTAAHRHHFGESDAPLFAKARAVSQLMNQHEAELCTPLLEALRQLPYRIIGRNQMQGREANIALLSEHHTSAHLSAALATNQIAAGHGHFYAKRLLESVGIPNSEDGVLRISFAHYNTEHEVTRVIDTLNTLH